MKVICVNTSHHIPDRAEINEGEIYTVARIVPEPKNFRYKEYYILAEKSPTFQYWVGLFIPLSDIDETAFVREPQKQHA